MSYHIYTTEAFVLQSLPHRENDGFFRVFTRDLGLIGASAKGVKRPHSKLALGLYSGSHANISLLRGKSSWRIVGVDPLSDTSRIFPSLSEQKKIWFRFLNTVKFFIKGEEKNNSIFEHAILFKKALERRIFSLEELFILECIAVFSLMSFLGYGTRRAEYEFMNLEDPFTDQTISQVLKFKSLLVEDINTAFRASQM